jgi:hypothetical protein
LRGERRRGEKIKKKNEKKKPLTDDKLPRPFRRSSMQCSILSLFKTDSCNVSNAEQIIIIKRKRGYQQNSQGGPLSFVFFSFFLQFLCSPLFRFFSIQSLLSLGLDSRAISWKKPSIRHPRKICIIICRLAG